MTFGFSRDRYRNRPFRLSRQKILASDAVPEHLNKDGVGQLIQNVCCRKAFTRPDLKEGICGEQGVVDRLPFESVSEQA